MLGPLALIYTKIEAGTVNDHIISNTALVETQDTKLKTKNDVVAQVGGSASADASAFPG